MAVFLKGSLLSAQYLRNPSFEERKDRDAFNLKFWENCNRYSTYDLQPECWNVHKPPSEGKRYISLVTRGDIGKKSSNHTEAVQSDLLKPLIKGEKYALSLDLAFSSTFTDDNDFNNHIKIRIWGAISGDEKAEVLWESETIENEDWETTKVELVPKDANYWSFIIEAVYAREKTYFGNVLIDNLKLDKIDSVSICSTPPPRINYPHRRLCPYSDDTVYVAQPTASGAVIKWYSQDDVLQHVGNKFSLDKSNRSVYYAVQETECKSQPVYISMSVKDSISSKFNEYYELCHDYSLFPRTYANDVFWFNSSQSFPPDTLSAIYRGYKYFPEITDSGDYRIWASEFIDGCLSEAFEISYHIKPKPEPVGLEFTYSIPCTDEFRPNISSGNISVLWFDSSMQKLLRYTSRFYPDVSKGLHQVFYVKQEVGGCTTDPIKVEFNANVESTPPVLKNDTICATDALPVVVADGAIAQVNWYRPGENTPFASGPHYQLQAGETEIFATNASEGCESEKAKYTLTKLPAPEAPVVSDTIVCSSSGFHLIEASGTNLSWYRDTSQQSIATGDACLLENPTEGHYQYYVRERVGSCWSPFSALMVSVNAPPSAPLVADRVVESCYGQTEQLQATGVPETSLIGWFDDEGKLLGEGPDFDPSGYLRKGMHTSFSAAQRKSGCWGPAVAIDYLMHRPVERPLLETASLCFGQDSLRVKANSKNLIQWEDEDGTVLGNGPSLDVSDLITGDGLHEVYAKAVSPEGCESETVVQQLSHGELPEPRIVGEDTVCGTQEELIFRVKEPNMNSQYIWGVDNEQTVLQLMDSSAVSVPVADYGISKIWLTEISPSGCRATFTLPVVIAPVPFADFMVNIDGRKAQFVNISETGFATPDSSAMPQIEATAEWSFGEPVLADAVFEWKDFYSVFTKSYSRGYKTVTLDVENEYGCSDKKEMGLFFESLNTLFVPNAFSPDHESEGVALFKPVGANLEKYEITIYDVWGNLVWYSSTLKDGAPAEGWDGTFKGTRLKPDNYVWKIEAVFKDGEVWQGVKDADGDYVHFGDLQLIR